MPKPLTYGDLTRIPKGLKGPSPILWCQSCGASYSANSADYWTVEDSRPIVCCEQPMRLVQRITTLKEVKLNAKA